MPLPGRSTGALGGFRRCAHDAASVPAPLHPSSTLAFQMRALGREEPPLSFELGGRVFVRTRVVKHDFWAATAFYQCSDGGAAVAKINRSAKFFGLGLGWIGRWLCNREMRFYSALREVENVPLLLGRIGRTGLIHEFVPGRPLAYEQAVPDNSFPDLQKLMSDIHARGMAYVDANKPQNVLLGEDGRPHLIDFQISFDLHAFGDWFLPRRILRHFQSADDYHVLKLKRKIRGDQLTAEERSRARRKSALIRAHRWLTRPYFALRRPAMRRLRDAGHLLPEGSK
jgi:hypothetical protein